MKKLHAIAAVSALAVTTGVSALETGSNGKNEWACGGAGAEERADMKTLESVATASLLFVTEVRGGYLADVDFVVRDQKGVTVLQGRADGPICVLRVPAGRYSVEALYEGTKRTASLQASAAPGKPTRAVLTFPRDPSETIAPSPEEKAQARAVSLN